MTSVHDVSQKQARTNLLLLASFQEHFQIEPGHDRTAASGVSAGRAAEQSQNTVQYSRVERLRRDAEQQLQGVNVPHGQHADEGVAGRVDFRLLYLQHVPEEIAECRC